MTDQPLTEQEVRAKFLGSVPRLARDWLRLRQRDVEKEAALVEAAEHREQLRQRLAEAERRYAELVKDTKQAVDDAGWAEELAEAKLAEAERERDEWKSRAEAMYQTEVGYTVALLEEQLAKARAALETIASLENSSLDAAIKFKAALNIAREALAAYVDKP